MIPTPFLPVPLTPKKRMSTVDRSKPDLARAEDGGGRGDGRKGRHGGRGRSAELRVRRLIRYAERLLRDAARGAARDPTRSPVEDARPRERRSTPRLARHDRGSRSLRRGRRQQGPRTDPCLLHSLPLVATHAATTAPARSPSRSAVLSSRRAHWQPCPCQTLSHSLGRSGVSSGATPLQPFQYAATRPRGCKLSCAKAPHAATICPVNHDSVGVPESRWHPAQNVVPLPPRTIFTSDSRQRAGASAPIDPVRIRAAAGVFDVGDLIPRLLLQTEPSRDAWIPLAEGAYLPESERVCPRARIDAGAPERFVRVDVPHPGEDALVEQRLLHRSPAGAESVA